MENLIIEITFSTNESNANYSIISAHSKLKVELKDQNKVELYREIYKDDSKTQKWLVGLYATQILSQVYPAYNTRVIETQVLN